MNLSHPSDLPLYVAWAANIAESRLWAVGVLRVWLYERGLVGEA